MTQPTPLASDLAAELLIHLARLAQSDGGPVEGGQRLTPAQWTALRFFARANRLSRTPSAFSAFHATTRGTASQTVKSLVEMGFLERHRNLDDGRSYRFDLTEAGRALLSDDPLKGLARRIDALPEAQRRTFMTVLRGLTAGLARGQLAPVFGTCADCAHCDAAGEAAFCRCAEATLLAGEMDALCIEFQPRAHHRPGRHPGYD